MLRLSHCTSPRQFQLPQSSQRIELRARFLFLALGEDEEGCLQLRLTYLVKNLHLLVYNPAAGEHDKHWAEHKQFHRHKPSLKR